MQRPLWSRLRPSCARHSSCPSVSPLSVLTIRETTRSQPHGTVDRCRRLATLTDDRYIYVAKPPERRSFIDNILFAIQGNDLAATSEAFLVWTQALGDEQHPSHQDALRELHQLPKTTLSEIIRSLDPIRRPQLDIAHGINIQEGRYLWTDVKHIVDEYGVRIHHKQVLGGMKAILNNRHTGPFPQHLTISDYEVFIRCAGASSDRYAAKLFWAATRFRSGLFAKRTSKLWTEFLKVRFFTELPYSQFDRSRFVGNARNSVTHTMSLSPDSRHVISRMDALRQSKNAFKRFPWGRVRDSPEYDEHRKLGRQNPRDERSFAAAWIRTHVKGYQVDEELLCTALVGFTRSQNIEMALTGVLKQHYGIDVNLETFEITGGFEFEGSSPLYPTTRLLQAIVDAFGATFEIPLAMALLDFVSQRYGMPITHSVWSNLLQWAAVAGAKDKRTLQNIYSANKMATKHRTHQVLHIWELMTSNPYNITPSFQDVDIFIKSLINMGLFYAADRAIREIGMPYVDSLSREFEAALFDEVLQLDDAAAFNRETVTSLAAHRRARAEARKTNAHYCAQVWLKYFATHGSKKPGKRSSYLVQLLPALVRDYPDFFLPTVEYRTKTAAITLNRGFAEINDRYTTQRQTMKRLVRGQKHSASYVFSKYDKPLRPDVNGETLYHREFCERGHEAYVEGENRATIFNNPAFRWPKARDMVVRQKMHRPLRRVTSWRVPLKNFDSAGGNDSFKKTLEKQLVL